MIKAYHVFLYLHTYHVSMYDYVCVVYLFLLESPRSIPFLETAPRPAGPATNLVDSRGGSQVQHALRKTTFYC